MVVGTWECTHLLFMRLQAEPELVADELDEKLNLKDEEKQTEAIVDETKAASPATSKPEPKPVEETPPPAPAPEEEEPEPDTGDSRQHLNVVFIGHVGTCYALLFLYFLSCEYYQLRHHSKFN